MTKLSTTDKWSYLWQTGLWHSSSYGRKTRSTPLTNLLKSLSVQDPWSSVSTVIPLIPRASITPGMWSPALSLLNWLGIGFAATWLETTLLTFPSSAPDSREAKHTRDPAQWATIWTSFCNIKKFHLSVYTDTAFNFTFVVFAKRLRLVFFFVVLSPLSLPLFFYYLQENT